MSEVSEARREVLDRFMGGTAEMGVNSCLALGPMGGGAASILGLELGLRLARRDILMVERIIEHVEHVAKELQAGNASVIAANGEMENQTEEYITGFLNAWDTAE